MAEIELNVLIWPCLSRRLESIELMSKEVRAWQAQRNALRAKINWQFTTDKCRIKLKRLYPTFTEGHDTSNINLINCKDIRMSLFFSIVIPAYNAEKTLRDTVDSAIRQTFARSCYEIIIIDDGSSDNTSKIMSDIATQNENVRLFTNEVNRGLGATRNRGINEARGTYIIFLDADDLLQSNALESFARVVELDHPDVVMANIARISEFGDALPSRTRTRHVLPHIVRDTIVGQRSFCSVGTAYETDFLRENNVRFTENAFYEDIEFAIISVLKANKINSINAILYFWVMRTGSITTSISPAKVRNAVRIWQQIGDILKNQEVFERYKKEWSTCVFEFLRLTNERIIQFAPKEEQDALHAMLLEEIDAAPELKEIKNLLPRLAVSQKAFRQAATATLPELPAIVEATAGAVVLLSQSRTHFNILAPLAQQLTRIGIANIVIDISRSKQFLKGLATTQADALQYPDIKLYFLETDIIYPLFFNARSYVFCSETGFCLNLIFKLKQRHIPTILLSNLIAPNRIPDDNALRCAQMGNTNYALISGSYIADMYSCPSTPVGIFHIKNLLQRPVIFPDEPLAVISLNFTLPLEANEQTAFLQSAVSACNTMGIRYIISVDQDWKGDRALFAPSMSLEEEDLARASFLITRTSTSILKALALNKPVIFHSPHDENIPRFAHLPPDAMLLSSSEDTLISAIKLAISMTAQKQDRRAGYKDFFNYYANTESQETPEAVAGAAIRDILQSDESNFQHRVLHFSGLLMASPKALVSNATPSKATPSKAATLNARQRDNLQGYQKASIIKKAIVLFLINRKALRADVRKLRKKLADRIRGRA